jgi:replicative DNA helicase
LSNSATTLNDPVAEDWLLVAMLCDASVFTELSSYPAGLFSTTPKQKLFGLMRDLWLKGNGVTRRALEYACVRSDGRKDGTLGVTLATVLKTPLSAFNEQPALIAKNLRDLYYRRELQKEIGILEARILNLGTTVDREAIRHVDSIMRLLQDGDEEAELVADIAVSRIEDLRSRPPGYNPCIPTGFPLLDENVAVAPGQITVVAARPSDGKSALGQLVATFAAKHNRTGLVCSPEMSKHEIIDRIISQECDVPLHALRTGHITKEDTWRKIRAGVEQFRNLFIFDDPDMTARDIALMARRINAKRKLDFLVIDYLQYLGIDEDFMKLPRTYQIAQSLRQVKSIARVLGVGILALAQLNRAVVDKDGSVRRPTLADLGDSGAIERDADVVLAIHHTDDVMLDGTRRVELIMLKNRNGERGVEHALWMPSRTMFMPLTVETPIPEARPEPVQEIMSLGKPPVNVINSKVGGTGCSVCEGTGRMWDEQVQTFGPCADCDGIERSAT